MTALRPRVGVMGGTFDPIHNGHLVAASEVAAALQLDEVIFVPTGEPWHKKVVSSSEHRYLMTVIATAANPRFTVSRVDIDRPGTTYTIDTLREVAQQRPNADLFFISGASRRDLATGSLCCCDQARPQPRTPRCPGGQHFDA
jgi:nicotinate-nucleotide adenylyltransferase